MKITANIGVEHPGLTIKRSVEIDYTPGSILRTLLAAPLEILRRAGEADRIEEEKRRER